MSIKLKESSLDVVLAFNGNGKTKLRDRTDLDKLAIIALQSNDKSLLELFESLPTLDELIHKKVEKELPKIPVENTQKVKS